MSMVLGSKSRLISICLAVLAFVSIAFTQRDKEEDPRAVVDFLVIKDDNGKPVRNAAVIMHPVSSNGKQGRGDVELKSSPEGRASFDGVPYGKLRVQVLATGFQTFGEDYDIEKPSLSLTVKLKRPQGQYSIYENHPDEKKGAAVPTVDPNPQPK